MRAACPEPSQRAWHQASAPTRDDFAHSREPIEKLLLRLTICEVCDPLVSAAAHIIVGQLRATIELATEQAHCQRAVGDACQVVLVTDSEDLRRVQQNVCSMLDRRTARLRRECGGTLRIPGAPAIRANQ